MRRQQGSEITWTNSRAGLSVALTWADPPQSWVQRTPSRDAAKSCQATFVQSALPGGGGGGAVGGIAPALDGILLKSSSFGRGDTTQSELLRSAAPSRRDAALRQLVFRGSRCFAKGRPLRREQARAPLLLATKFPPKPLCKKASDNR